MERVERVTTSRSKKKSIKVKKDTKEEDLFLPSEEFDDSPDEDGVSEYSVRASSDDNNELVEELESQIEKSLLSEIEKDDVEEDDEWVAQHPAEIAAAAEIDESARENIGGSDEQILRDLRRLVFSVPLLPAKEVLSRFIKIDSLMFPVTYRILQSSEHHFEEVLQVILKVAAGTTYGKNIYEKCDLSDDEKEKEKVAQSGSRITFKEHEREFIKCAWFYLRQAALSQTKKERDLKAIDKAMGLCAFIRGIYEEVISSFVQETKHYNYLCWEAARLRTTSDFEGYAKCLEVIHEIEKRVKAQYPIYGIARDASFVWEKFLEHRAAVISPYLRSVYSGARNTARNAHQMLDNFQNGSLGLIRAVSCYSTRRVASFSSVAKWWIKQMMLLSIKEDANFVKLPVSTWQAFTKLEKYRVKHRIHEEDPAKAKKLFIITMMMEKEKASSDKTNYVIPEEKIKSIYSTVKMAQVYSLNRTYDSDEKLTLEDLMTNEDQIGYDPDNLSSLVRDYIAESKLNNNELKIIALSHGLWDMMSSDDDIPKQELWKEAITQNLMKLGYEFKA